MRSEIASDPCDGKSVLVHIYGIEIDPVVGSWEVIRRQPHLKGSVVCLHCRQERALNQGLSAQFAICVLKRILLCRARHGPGLPPLTSGIRLCYVVLDEVSLKRSRVASVTEFAAQNSLELRRQRRRDSQAE